MFRRAKNLRTAQLLLGHPKLESTIKYLGIEVDDALEIAKQTEFRTDRPGIGKICGSWPLPNS